MLNTNVNMNVSPTHLQQFHGWGEASKWNIKQKLIHTTALHAVSNSNWGVNGGRVP